MPPAGPTSTSSVNGIPLLGDKRTAGGAFELDRIAEADVDITYDGGWSVHLRSGRSTVIVRGCDVSDFRPVAAAVPVAAARGLDLLCAYDGPAYALAKTSEEAIFFWPSDAGLKVCWFSTYRFGTRIRASAEVTRADGTKVVSPQIPWNHHPSFVHFRRSQIETDLGDSYRHAYLTLESILDTIRPQAAGETEGAWLMAALIEANRVAEPYHSESTRESIAGKQYQEWYDEARKHLFHSKPSRSTSNLALGLSDFDALLKKKQALLMYYMQLVRTHLNIRNGAGGGMTHVGFEYSVLSRYEEDLQLSAADDSDPAVVAIPASMIREAHSAAPTGEGHFYCRSVNIPRSSRVRRWDLKHAGESTFRTELEQGTIELDSRDVLVARLRLVNGSGDFKQRFLT